VVVLIEIRGIGVSGKKASGIAYKMEKKQIVYHDARKIDKGREKSRFLEILDLAKAEIEQLLEKANMVDQSAAEIFESHELLLSDVEVIHYIDQLLDYGYNLESALIRTKEDMKSHFLNMQSEIFRSKIADIDDVFDRLIRLESGSSDEQGVPNQPFILVCDDILPSLIYRLPEEHLKGIITKFGSNCSHGAIMARSRNIPVIIRIKNRYEMIKNQDPIIMNGESGAIFILDK